MEEDGGKKMIYTSRSSSSLVKVVIKDGGGRLVTERGAVLKVWEGYFNELWNRGGSNGELELLSYVVLWKM